MRREERVVCRTCHGNGSSPVRTTAQNQLGWAWQLCVVCHGSGTEVREVIDVEGEETSRKLRPYARYTGGRHG